MDSSISGWTLAIRYQNCICSSRSRNNSSSWNRRKDWYLGPRMCGMSLSLIVTYVISLRSTFSQTFELLTGGSLFNLASGGNERSRDQKHLVKMLELGGGQRLDKHLWGTAKAYNTYFNSEGRYCSTEYARAQLTYQYHLQGTWSAFQTSLPLISSASLQIIMSSLRNKLR